MRRTHSTSVIVVPRRRKHSRKLKKDRPTASVQESFQLPSASSKQCALLTIISTRSRAPLIITDNTLSFKNRNINILSNDKTKKKKALPKPWIVLVIVLIIVCILSGVSVGTYFLVRLSVKVVSKDAVLRWKLDGVTVAGISGLPGTNATQLNAPYDLAWSSSKKLYITDALNNRIQKWSIGAFSGSTVAGFVNGSSGATPQHLASPLGLYVDSDDNIYVADSGNHRIQFFSKGSSIGMTAAGTGSFGTANNQFFTPPGVSLDPATKTMYVADYNNHRIMGYAHSASTGWVAAGINLIGGFNNSLLYYPTRVQFDQITNSLVIANSAANNVVQWTLTASSWSLIAGNSTGAFGNSSTLLHSPIGITLDPMGNVYAADVINNRIQLFEKGQTEGRTIAGVTGIASINATHLYYPYSVILDSQLNLYVSDTYNHRIQRFQRY